jgi:hypothetical protein
LGIRVQGRERARRNNKRGVFSGLGLQDKKGEEGFQKREVYTVRV